MAWFAVHQIEYFKYRQGKQDVFPVYENIYLFEAENSDEAREKAENFFKEVNFDDKTLTLEDKPAKSINAGIRKIVEITHWDEEGILKSKDEITWNEFNVFDEKDIEKILKGEYVNVEYLE